MQKRRQDIDAVAGLMILWMVVGHICQVTGWNPDYPRVLFFFMPWFYYKSGVLSRDNTLRTSVIVGGGKKLFAPFIKFAIVGQVVLTICMLIEGETSLKPYLYSPIRSLVLGGNIGGNTPLWFIPSLYVTQCVATSILNKKNVPWLLGIASITLGYGLYLLDIPFVPTYVESAFGGVFFYCSGRTMREKQYDWRIILAAVLIMGVALLTRVPMFDVRGNGVSNGNYILGAIVAISGCVIANNVFHWIQPWLKLNLLQWIGRNAMIIYVTHWIWLLVSIRLIVTDLLHIYETRILIIIGLLTCIVAMPIHIKWIEKWQKKS